MALQQSGKITINDIAGEFGGDKPHGLSEYYDVASGVPKTGTIKNSDFYGTSNIPNLNFPGDWNGAGRGVWKETKIGKWIPSGAGIKKNYMSVHQNKGNGYVCPPGKNGEVTGSMKVDFVDDFRIDTTIGKTYGLKIRFSSTSFFQGGANITGRSISIGVSPEGVNSKNGYFGKFNTGTEHIGYYKGPNFTQFNPYLTHSQGENTPFLASNIDFIYKWKAIADDVQTSGDRATNIVLSCVCSSGNGCSGEAAANFSYVEYLGEIA